MCHLCLPGILALDLGWLWLIELHLKTKEWLGFWWNKSKKVKYDSYDVILKGYSTSDDMTAYPRYNKSFLWFQYNRLKLVITQAHFKITIKEPDKLNDWNRFILENSFQTRQLTIKKTKSTNLSKSHHHKVIKGAPNPRTFSFFGPSWLLAINIWIMSLYSKTSKPKFLHLKNK